MRLSLAWGVPPDALADRMGSEALAEWQEYFALAPEDERADRRHAMRMSLFANAHRDPKTARPFNDRDFLPPWRAIHEPVDEPEPDPEATCDGIARAIKREKNR